MIQRKQTVFLLLAFLLTVVCMCTRIGMITSDGIVVARVYNLWLSNGQGLHSFVVWPMLVVLLLSSLLSIVAVFLYMKRKLQATMCLWNMLLLVIWYLGLAVLPTQNGGELALEWPAVLPAIGIVLIFMARKGIIADEKLVRSMDRIR